MNIKSKYGVPHLSTLPKFSVNHTSLQTCHVKCMWVSLTMQRHLYLGHVKSLSAHPMLSDEGFFSAPCKLKTNSFMSNWLFYLNSFDWFISNRKDVWLTFIFTAFYRNSYIWCKQCRPWSDAAYCGVWSGSSPFASAPFINSYIWCKQCTSWSDAACRGVWSGSSPFASVPYKGGCHKWVNVTGVR